MRASTITRITIATTAPRRPRAVIAGAVALWAAAGLGAPAPASAEAALAEGQPAPAFKAKGDDGKEYSLAAFKGKTVVLYFYPKDDTPGCTVEAQEFRDAFEKFSARGAVVLGVSMDSGESHAAFRKKHQLNFPLLIGDEELARAYGVPVSGGFAARQSFVIARDGKIKKIFRQVNPRGHSAEILAIL
jgi:peroxiredoxin Q/BCP